MTFTTKIIISMVAGAIVGAFFASFGATMEPVTDFIIGGVLDAIGRIFGTGAKILEIQIMKCLFKKAGCTIKHYPERNGLEFAEYLEAVKHAKKKYENSNEPQPN